MKNTIRLKISNQGLIDPDPVFNRDHDRDKKNLPTWLDQNQDSDPHHSRQANPHFPWRCNSLRFWEAGLRGEWGVGGMENVGRFWSVGR